MPDGFRRFYLLTLLSLCLSNSIPLSRSLHAASNPASGCWSFPGMSTLEVGTKWWVESDAFKQRQLAALKTEIAQGISQLADGRYTTYDDSTVRQLAEEVNRASRQ